MLHLAMIVLHCRFFGLLSVVHFTVVHLAMVLLHFLVPRIHARERGLDVRLGVDQELPRNDDFLAGFEARADGYTVVRLDTERDRERPEAAFTQSEDDA